MGGTPSSFSCLTMARSPYPSFASRKMRRTTSAAEGTSRELKRSVGSNTLHVRLDDSARMEEAERILALAADPNDHFMVIIPEKVQADPSISTE